MHTREAGGDEDVGKASAAFPVYTPESSARSCARWGRLAGTVVSAAAFSQNAWRRQAPFRWQRKQKACCLKGGNPVTIEYRHFRLEISPEVLLLLLPVLIELL